MHSRFLYGMAQVIPPIEIQDRLRDSTEDARPAASAEREPEVAFGVVDDGRAGG